MGPKNGVKKKFFIFVFVFFLLHIEDNLSTLGIVHFSAVQEENIQPRVESIAVPVVCVVCAFLCRDNELFFFSNKINVHIVPHCKVTKKTAHFSWAHLSWDKYACVLGQMRPGTNVHLSCDKCTFGI